MHGVFGIWQFAPVYGSVFDSSKEIRVIPAMRSNTTCPPYRFQQTTCRCIAIAALAFGICVNATVANAQESSSVFSGDSATAPAPTFGEMASKMNPMNWQMPKFKMPSFSGVMPGQEDKDRIIKKKDSLFSDVGATAKRSWTRTKEVLNPARLNPMNMFAGNASKPVTTETKKPGFFGSLFAQPEPEEKVATVGEFLSQDRIR
ncbi:hypothetical protein Pan14r_06890 [Crateriforma conspicua]|uniref:Uncharacterized protein n=2 Tax=Crateriforma conspicua TaxID=2527996 RepID=A0A5C5XZX3_9PLAN|nr:hypothetical protein Pan14r_06890 [Crateriforma conspicua]